MLGALGSPNVLPAKPSAPVFACNMCDTTRTSEGGLQKHKIRNHWEKKYNAINLSCVSVCYYWSNALLILVSHLWKVCGDGTSCNSKRLLRGLLLYFIICSNIGNIGILEKRISLKCSVPWLHAYNFLECLCHAAKSACTNVAIPT